MARWEWDHERDDEEEKLKKILKHKPEPGEPEDDEFEDDPGDIEEDEF
jgi:hypothetical protein